MVDTQQSAFASDSDAFAVRRNVGDTAFAFGHRLGDLQFGAFSGFGVQKDDFVSLAIGMWQAVVTKHDQRTLGHYDGEVAQVRCDLDAGNTAWFFRFTFRPFKCLLGIGFNIIDIAQ